MGLNALFHVAKNPLPWLDEMLNAVEHANFFENRATEYSKASTVGTWEEAFDAPVAALVAAGCARLERSEACLKLKISGRCQDISLAIEGHFRL